MRLCDPGMVAVDVEHCCWPGQHWTIRADGEAGCGGPPTCPSPLVPNGDDCMSPDAISAKQSHDDAVGLWGAGYLTFEAGLNFASAPNSASWTNYDFNVSIKPVGTPIRIGIGTFGGSIKFTSDCTDSSFCFTPAGEQTTTGDLGWYGSIAFAPFSIPNAASSSVSFLNPWVGITGRAWLITGASDESDPTRPKSGGSVALSVGDLIMLGHFGISVSIEPSFYGSDSRPNTWTRIALAWALPLF